MIIFDYQARDTKGQMVKGQIEALHEQEALDKLWARSLLGFSVKQVKASKTQSNRSGGKMPGKDLILFTRQLGAMLNAGLAITVALDALKRQTKTESSIAILQYISRAIEEGGSLSEALSQHPRVFSKLYVSLVRAGEISGSLANVLDRIARYLEGSQRLRRRVLAAAAYPASVCVIALGISLFLVLKVIPIFSAIYADLGHALPLPTMLLIQFSDLLRHYLLFCIVGLAVGIYAISSLLRTPAGALAWDRCKLRIPIVGMFTSKIVFAGFARTCSLLLHSGVPILTTLRVVAESSGNGVIEASLLEVANVVEQGSSLTEALLREPLFPPMMVEMIAAGEQTGKVSEMLEQVGDYYEEEVETALNGLAAMIEPLLILFLGVVVGSIVLCMFLPIFKLSEAVQF